MQETKLSGGHVSEFSANREGHGIAVEFEVGRGDVGGGHRLLKAAQHRSDARYELPSAERLGDVVVGAQIQAANAVFFTSFGGEKDDREARQIAVFPDLPADVKAAVAGDHDIEQEK